MDSCVYTALVGGYERLNEQPVAAGSSVRFICFTDDPELRSESWEIRLFEPVFPRDAIRSQRDVKLRPHYYLTEFARSLYIDNSVILKAPPETLLNMLAEAPDGVVMAPHSFRKTVLDEFLEVARLGMEDNSRIFEQLNHYLLSDADALDEQPWWGGIIVRVHDAPKLISASDIWAMHVMRYSRRDQLSVNIAFRMAGLKPLPLNIDTFVSNLHSWPHTAGRDRDRGDRAIIRSMMPLAGRLRAMENELSSVMGSASWRITAPLRLTSQVISHLIRALKNMLKLSRFRR
jgi:hypothetical protein